MDIIFCAPREKFKSNLPLYSGHPISFFWKIKVKCYSVFKCFYLTYISAISFLWSFLQPRCYSKTREISEIYPWQNYLNPLRSGHLVIEDIFFRNRFDCIFSEGFCGHKLNFLPFFLFLFFSFFFLQEKTKNSEKKVKKD